MKPRIKSITVAAISFLLLAAPLYAAKPDKPLKGDKEAKTLLKQERKAGMESHKAKPEEKLTGLEKQRVKRRNRSRRNWGKVPNRVRSPGKGVKSGGNSGNRHS